jgi:hypothetical protein
MGYSYHFLGESCPEFPGGGLLTEELASQVYGVHDFLISGAATEVSGQGLFDIRIRGVGILVQQGFGSHNHTGSAVPALDGAGKDIGFLNIVWILRGPQSLYRDNVSAFQVDHLF